MIDLVSKNMERIIKLFTDYYGNYTYFVLFLVAIAINYAIIKKDEKKAQNLVVFLPLVLMLIVINPFVFEFVKPFTDKGYVYWRFFWILPLAPTMAYLFTKMVNEKKGFFSKVILTIFIIVIIGFSGKFMFTENNYQKVNNYYKIPDDIYSCIASISAQEKDNKKAMIPISVVPWVRQYDATISIEYNRSPSGNYSRFVWDYEVGKVNEYMKKYLDDKCNFFVLNKSVQYDISFEDYNCERIYENDSYIVYMLKD